jgi:hypothetical protein
MLAGIVSIAIGCQIVPREHEQSPKDFKVEPDSREEASVEFDLKLSSGSSGTEILESYDCIYHARGKTAKFRLEFKHDQRFAAALPLGAAQGKFLAVAGSDNSALLEDLKTVLDAKKVPKNSRRISELAFDAAILGEKQSRGASGGFSANPPGDWTLIKVFLPKGADEAEMYLNLNPVLGKGEFSLKDSDYGDYLLKALAKVL